MQNLAAIDIDWANVNWLYVTVLAIFVFFSTMIGTLGMPADITGAAPQNVQLSCN
jgi:hypothetical protein